LGNLLEVEEKKATVDKYWQSVPARLVQFVSRGRL
jgi:hypothetical protein